ncbi:hypothetical protein KAM380_023460 [Aeromonas caviae]|nr:hypothetical protein KAM380_023460 [Aeromonas caviae]
MCRDGPQSGPPDFSINATIAGAAMQPIATLGRYYTASYLPQNPPPQTPAPPVPSRASLKAPYRPEWTAQASSKCISGGLRLKPRVITVR